MGLPSLVPINKERPVKIYGLFDPRSTFCFYIGATSKTVNNRLSSHVNDAISQNMTGEKSELIRSIIDDGMRPEIVELETVTDGYWPDAEQFWIENMRAFGFKLANKSVGGAGAYGTKQSELTRTRRQAAAAGRDMTHLHGPEIRDKVSLKTRTPIMYEGVTYAGLAVAARALGISSGHMHYKVSKEYATRVAA